MFSLIGAHAWLGELGALMFIWVFIELLNPTEVRVKRAATVAIWAIVFIFSSWILGGYYYVNFYGPVKAIIKEGPMPWSHKVVTETKEHIFLFLPLLSILNYGFIKRFGVRAITDRKVKLALLWVTAASALVTLAMAGFGFLITSGFREALEAIVL